eukprot:TRINITY_DN60542_c0_g3_i1.p1 TRINITY_DN60542_c0_g3~~TRINITY_DN60542_c0_g3_i1.p1  ORF type:complete len:267 (+),score=36.45 TRINITY_DN60542_c0_g3_i1:29-829(+)
MDSSSFQVGKPRPTHNAIINQTKSEVGKSRPQLHPVSEDANYTYGIPCKRDPEGAGEVMLSWKEHAPRKKEIDLGRDFIALNKRAAKSKAVRPTDVTAFRATNDARIKPQRNLPPKKAYLSDENMAFGKKTCKDNTTVRDLMQNKYEMDWVNDQQNKAHRKYAKQAKQEALRQSSPLRVRSHISPLLRHQQQQQQEANAPANTFVMKKFQNIPAKLAWTRTPSPAAMGMTRAQSTEPGPIDPLGYDAAERESQRSASVLGGSLPPL